MTSPIRPRWHLVAMTAAAIIVSVAAILSLWYLQQAGSFDAKTATPHAEFTYDDVLDCAVQFSTHKAGEGLALPWLEVPSFTLSGLDGDSPTMTTTYHSQSVAMRKVYDSPEYVTLTYAAESWNTMTIGIEKSAGAFVQAATGIQAGEPPFHYALAMKGACE